MVGLPNAEQLLTRAQLIPDRDRALYLVVDKPGEHIRFRYLHMSPEMLDAAGMFSGRTVVEGEVLGAVGNYGNTERGTSYHLHFDAQVPTRAGWDRFRSSQNHPHRRPQ